jgi:ribA/ribD-fused uncharacterized protein
MSKESATRRYLISESVLFRKTKQDFGGLSNMAAGFSLHINEVIIPTSEHLYQALRFPDNPSLQWDIISEKSPMKAKWIGRAHIKDTRPDWDKLQFQIMLWSLRVKLSQNWDSFSSLLKATGDKHIVEVTPKPKVWGAVIKGDYCEGINALGRLLMFARESYVKQNRRIYCVSPLEVENFKFLGFPIGVICDDFTDDEGGIDTAISEQLVLA